MLFFPSPHHFFPAPFGFVVRLVHPPSSFESSFPFLFQRISLTILFATQCRAFSSSWQTLASVSVKGGFFFFVGPFLIQNISPPFLGLLLPRSRAFARRRKIFPGDFLEPSSSFWVSRLHSSSPNFFPGPFFFLTHRQWSFFFFFFSALCIPFLSPKNLAYQRRTFFSPVRPSLVFHLKEAFFEVGFFSRFANRPFFFFRAFPLASIVSSSSWKKFVARLF